MKKRAGGSNVEKPPENDIYIHPTHAEEIVNYLSPHFPDDYKFNILDACCGFGTLGKAIEKYCLKNGIYFDAVYQDIKFGNSILNLDKRNFENFDIIICNPPWVPVELPEAIYHHLKHFLSEDGVLIFIINNTFCYQGIERAVLLDYQKYYFLPRFAFKPAGKNLLDPGIMIFHRGYYSMEAARLRPFIPLSRISERLEYNQKHISKNLFEEVS